LRPLARRRLRIARPARVDIRARNPCRRFRRRTFGWKVRFTEDREGVWDATDACRPPGQYREARLPADGSAELCGDSERPRRPCSRSPAQRSSDQCRKICTRGNPQAKDRMATGLAPPFHSCGDCCGKEDFACSDPVFRASGRMFSSVEGPRRRCYDRRFPESGGGSNKPACNALLN
jgi:hypothetical protein